MKHLNQFITEYIVKKKLDKPIDSEDHYEYFPKSTQELVNNIKKLLDKGETDLNCINTSAIKDMSNLFNRNYTTIIIPDNIDISKWDVSNVESMIGIFFDCRKFNCDLSRWNISNVKKASYMFYNCEKFEGKGLDNWDVSNVTDMHRMFFNCNNLKCDLSNWDVSKVEDMNSMFVLCKNFKGKGLDNWNVSKVENMSYMFQNCENFNCDLSNWDISKVINMESMFQNCENFNCDLSKWDVNNVNIYKMFKGCTLLKNKPNWYKE